MVKPLSFAVPVFSFLLLPKSAIHLTQGLSLEGDDDLEDQHCSRGAGAREKHLGRVLICSYFEVSEISSTFPASFFDRHTLAMLPPASHFITTVHCTSLWM